MNHEILVNAAYIVGVGVVHPRLEMLGARRPRTARRGNVISGSGMLIAIVVRQAPAWLDGSRPLPPAQRRALLAITRCRTPALGGHVYRCTDCEREDFAYHSCHHRACPRCGGAGTAEWTQKQTDRLLPVPYFLVTFTVV